MCNQRHHRIQIRLRPEPSRLRITTPGLRRRRLWSPTHLTRSTASGPQLPVTACLRFLLENTRRRPVIAAITVTRRVTRVGILRSPSPSTKLHTNFHIPVGDGRSRELDIHSNCCSQDKF